MELSKLTKMFLETLSQIKVLHWNTTKYSVHKALDELYSTIGSSSDAFIESFMGKYGNTVSFKILMSADTNTELFKFLETEREKIKVLHGKFKKDTELQTILDDMMNAFNKAIYLCRLE
jgi:RNA binding exosome subunit